MFRKNKTIIHIFLVIFIIFSAGIIGFYLGSLNNASINQNTNTPDAQTNYNSSPFPSEIYSVSGYIQEINGQTITLKDKDIMINTDENTQFVQKDGSAPPPIPGEEIENTETNITLSDLKINNYITASSEENIKNLEKFTANKIILINL